MANCETCATNYFGLPIDETVKVYCLPNCPTGYNNSSTCVLYSSGNTVAKIAEFTFNDFKSSWTNNGLIINQDSAYPAKNRGQYLNNVKEFQFANTFHLNIHFSLMTWIRPDDDPNKTNRKTIMQKFYGFFRVELLTIDYVLNS